MRIDPDPAFFYLDADKDPGRKTNADPRENFTSQKLEFLHEKIHLKLVIGQRNIPTNTKVQKPF